MGLEILHKSAENMHENEQFRRIAKSMKILFDKMKWDGLLIGNPYTTDFSRFRADALLYYNKGLIIIDLKDYSGEINLPTSFNELKSSQWYIENETDKRRTLVKGGSYKNPFAQLNTYRFTLKELIKSNLILSESINGERICISNIFRPSIKLVRDVPRDVPYYRITDETTFQTLLCDFASSDKFSKDAATEFKRIFPSEPWIEMFDLNIAPKENIPFLELVDDSFKTVISEFINHPEQQILILESGDTRKRDEWMQYILSEATSFDIPQTEVWAHSTRIARRIKKRTGIEPQSLFCTIYGGNVDNTIDAETPEISTEENSENNSEKIPEQMQDNVGIRSDKELDDKCLLILSEAHLVTRTLFQTELLRFGTGRLLEDLFRHVKLLATKRKIIFIGDPYSLSYGKEDESALSKETIIQLYEGEVLKFRDKFDDRNESAINKFRGNLISSIDQNKYNNLPLEWDNQTLLNVDKPQAEKLFHSWFKNPVENDPEHAVLVFKNTDSLTISRWIRKNVQNKKEDFVQGDILLADNNFNIPDEMGLSLPHRIQNGMYLRIEEKLDRYEETIPLKGNQPITLKFIKLKVTCLSLSPQQQAEIWILENFFTNSYDLTLEEQIAYRIFVKNRVRKNAKFEDSVNQKKLLESSQYRDLIRKHNELQIALNLGEKVKGKLDEVTVQINKLNRKEKGIFEREAFLQVMNTDPLVNAAKVQYAYSMTVHKALGSSFKEIVLNAFQGENRGITNEDYFRWLYTGISCGLDSVKIINPAFIHPLMNCVFEDTINVSSPEPVQVIKKTVLIFPEVQLNQQLKKFSIAELGENVKRGGTLLSNLLEPHGYLIDNVSISSFLLKLIFTIPNGNVLEEKDKLHIAMNYNGKKEVTVIKIDKAGKSDRELIEQCISQLSENTEPEKEIASLKLPVDYRNKIYQKWIDECASKGFLLRMTEDHNNQNVFTIKKGSICGKFRIYFTLVGFFTKMVMIEKSTEELGSEMKAILLDGNQA